MTKEPTNNFVALSDEVVHSWAIFRLIRRYTASPTGEKFERTFVSTPGAVACVPVTKDGEVVLVSQFRATFNSYVLEVPAGMRDVDGEPAEVTAIRELKEETGFVATSVSHLGQCLSSPGVTDSSVEIFLATDIEPGVAEPHGPEEDFMRVVTMPISEALAMVDDGRIVDAKTAYGLLLAARRYPNLVH